MTLPKRGIAVLLVAEPSAARRKLVRRLCADARTRVHMAGGAAEALEALARHPHGILIVTRHLNGTDGIDLLRAAKERWPHVRRVLLAREVSTDTVVEAVNRAGVPRWSATA